MMKVIVIWKEAMEKFRRFIWKTHCVKSVQIRSFFWSVFSCIRTEYRKIRTRKYSVCGHFSSTILSFKKCFPFLSSILYLAPFLKALKLNKRRERLLEEMWYVNIIQILQVRRFKKVYATF